MAISLRIAPQPLVTLAAFVFGVGCTSSPPPATDDTWLVAAVAQEDAGDLDAAIASRKEALKLPPNSPFEYLGLAQVQAKSQRLAEGMATVTLGLVAFPGDVDLQLRRAEYLSLAGQHQEALTLVNRLGAQNRDHLGVAYAVVDIRLRAGDVTGAGEALTSLKDPFGEEPEYRLRQGQIALEAGDGALARAHWARGVEAAGDCPCTEEVRGQLASLKSKIDTAAIDKSANDGGDPGTP